jgi:hypothetical protein
MSEIYDNIFDIFRIRHKPQIHCNNGLQAKTRLLLDRGADVHLRDVRCMSVLEHTSRSLVFQLF